MSDELVIQIASLAVYTVLKAAGPMLLMALVVGLTISIIQATTQINEQTLVFVPKIVAVLIGLLLFGPWILTTLVEFAGSILGNLTEYIR